MIQAAPVPALSLNTSRQFTSWLAEQSSGLVFTTYQAGKVFFVGLQPNGNLSVNERTFERCMGLAAAGNSLYMSSLYQLWRFENALEPGQTYQDYDALYVPQISYVTGDLDVHDIVAQPIEDSSGRTRHSPLFVNTLFSCLATTSETDSFTPVWQPPFISKLAAEDRCHLNGLALKDGQPKYVTAVSQSDMAEGWRDQRTDGGCVVDVETNEVIATGLSMPHSPRWYQNRLWVLNSGRGEFGYVDLDTGRFEPIAFCPGYLRGCAFVGQFAIAGVSKPRDNQTFSGLPLDDLLLQKATEPRCGLLVIDLRSGDIVHSLRIDGVVEELYDVQILPGIRRPMAIGIRNDEIRRFIRVGS
ncbi:TIGR03032 family protein [Pseudanabaena sp. FACHB-2040]|uniref:TIGR03032 family protein n=1 Tax=Pseudanabaena sp. FACHB-2040 TaxID=2692859 RepID=UPI00168962C6|nr:TIGR03032 family protein [Pseudanabaena sp. FACHB-2040]MBD2261265.1 TIGR03032 family protein [Pseudanabaena sp. FACHB-2040]